MAVKIGHSASSENGTIYGNAGDQTGREVRTDNWYPGGWNKLIRAKTTTVAEKIAKAMEDACANNNIGYDQGQRTTLYDEAKKLNWNIAKITTKCECDCSSLVAVCVNVAGISVSKDLYTGNLASGLRKTGEFHIYTASKYLTSETELKRGDILLKEGSHVVVVLSDYEKAPAASTEATKPTSTPATALKFKVGDNVNFTGNKHYTSSYFSGVGKSCKPGLAKVTAISPGKPHPYHVVAISGKGSNVWGWVNESDVEKVSVASDNIAVGDIVYYDGNVHHTSSYKTGVAKPCKGGYAEVTAIKRGNPHPYHLVRVAGKGATVWGWVDADKVKKK